MGERWRRIPLHPGYEASSEGRIRSVDRTLPDGREAGGAVLTPWPDKDGYLRVKLGRKTAAVHVLVCLAFHGRPEVRHLGENNQDNRPTKLAWGSRRDNNGRDKKEKERRKLGHLGSHPLRFETLSGTSLTLSEAVTTGTVSCSLDAVRKAAQRDQFFPQVKARRGLANLYDAAEMAAWNRDRQGL